MELKKIGILIYCIAITIAVLYVPWKQDWHNDMYTGKVDQGYHFVFSAPLRTATIDYGVVLLELTAITAIAGVIYMLVGLIQSKSAK